MRTRRPELFSDSTHTTEHLLERSVLEYQLDTLTNRKQENEFEYFCRKLSEKELCPNLLPQTGPTGGGDSKADTETYPVADTIALRWYEGLGMEASKERWAFAFSAKKDWRSKVQGDVREIAGTQRDCKLIYFMTNQFVKDKARAEVEDALKSKYGMAVRILDRSWILDRVFENDRHQIAIDALKITGYEAKKKVAGPRDLEREAELRELESQIETTERYQGVEYQLAEDCLRAAILARNLELPRVEVEGRLTRAENIAEKFGSQQQRLRITYTRAWSVFWWYDDFHELSRLYDLVEGLAENSTQASDLGLLTNLWQILHTTVRAGQLTGEIAKLPSRTAKLKAELKRLAAELTRPNNALQARTSILLIDLSSAIGNIAQVSAVLTELKKVIAASSGLASYPLLPLIDIVRELGEVLPDNQEYDELFESMLKLADHRASSSETGRMLLQRGLQKLEAGKHYDAIRLLGRAQPRLAVRECLPELVTALGGCGSAYEQAGLLWAARGNTLTAANHALSVFREHGRVTSLAARCVQRLVWLELQLGRVPCALAWLTAAKVLYDHLMLQGERKAAFVEERDTQAMVLGLLLLKADLWELKGLNFLPSLLEYHELFFSRMALLYALGYEDRLRTDGEIPASEGKEAVYEFFAEWLNQPANKDLPNKPEFLLHPKVIFRSPVLGCDIIMKVANNLTSIQLGESLLGILEAILATSLGGRVLPYRSEFQIDISPSDFIVGIPEYKVQHVNGIPVLNIQHAPQITYTTADERNSFFAGLLEIVVTVFSQIAVIDKAESYFKKLADEEAVFRRALDIADISTCVANILGEAPKLQIAEWRKDWQGESFDLRRDEPWDSASKKRALETTSKPTKPRPGDGDLPLKMTSTDQLKHRDRKVVSIIDIPLWGQAKWIAAVYAYHPDPRQPPYLALGYRNADAAKAIFQGLRARLGEVDAKELLRVSIITGVDIKHPSSYSVIIGMNPGADEIQAEDAHWITTAQIHRMDPPDSKNLDAFLAKWRQAGRYLLLPAHFSSEAGPPQLYIDHTIEKHELHFRPAWEIGRNDPDICAIIPGDKPVIPKGVDNAPVIEALKWLAKERKRRK